MTQGTGGDSMGAAAEQTEAALNPVLGPVSLMGIGIGAIIGSGIFVLTGVVAARFSGPAVTLSLIVAGLGCLCAALCYAEMASMIPASGSAYSYTYATLGRTAAWVVGWSLCMEYLFAASSVAVGWSGYFGSMLASLGWQLPHALVSAPLDSPDGLHIIGTGALLNVPAISITAFLALLVAVGIRQSAFATNVIVAVKLLVIAIFVVVGARFVDPVNWHPYVPPNMGHFGNFGWSGVLRGAGVVFVAYLGFDAISTASQEARNPRVDVPRALLGSLAVCSVLYIAVAVVVTGLAPSYSLDVPNPIAFAVARVGQPLAWLLPLINLGALFGLTSVALVLLYGQSRIFFAMAGDGLLPATFGRVHPRLRTPVGGIVVSAVVCAVLAGLFPVGLLAEMDSIGTLLAFTVVCAGVLILRRKAPNVQRKFRVPFGPFIPVTGVIMCLGLMVSLSIGTWLRLLGWLIIGAVYYKYRSHGARHVASSHARATNLFTESPGSTEKSKRP
jgi:basic amino acid/polyamine antiporter, APA family